MRPSIIKKVSEKSKQPTITTVFSSHVESNYVCMCAIICLAFIIVLNVVPVSLLLAYIIHVDTHINVHFEG